MGRVRRPRDGHGHPARSSRRKRRHSRRAPRPQDSDNDSGSDSSDTGEPGASDHPFEGTTSVPWRSVLFVVVVAIASLTLVVLSMRASPVAMIKIDGHAGVGHTGGSARHKVVTQTTDRWKQHDHKWRPKRNPRIDCPRAIEDVYGHHGEEDWIAGMSMLMEHNPTVSRFYSQDGEDMFLMQRFFRQPVALRGVFVDVGAFDGHTHSNTKTFEEAFKWRGICIEPSPPNFGDLTQRRPRCTNYNAAVCPQPGTTLVYGEGASANQKPNTGLRGSTFRTGYQVACGPLAAFVKASGFTHIDLLSIDAGGRELDVVTSHNWTQYPVLVTIVEMAEATEVYNSMAREHLVQQGLCRVALGVGHSSEVFVNRTRFLQSDPLEDWPLEPSPDYTHHLSRL